MKLPEEFGSMVFGDKAMKEYLTCKTYEKYKKTATEGAALSEDIAGEVARGMKKWAIDNGATHFTHWFQPLTGVTAEKHDSFLSFDKTGNPIMEFSAKELIKGEGDASSFPSGGLRATFEARGYTAWDPTSYAFIKDNTLCIPTVFCSYSGATLDKKTPLLRSLELVKNSSARVLEILGEKPKNVSASVGAEQEYFLVDKEFCKKRTDLMYCGRTVFGVKPPKAQELSDHYYGNIKPRVKEFMSALDEELWKLGIYAKTEHNEVAPAQHELAPIFSDINTACDQNQLIMETLKKVAERFGLVCLLHEKPFDYVNGSGKHNNWSLEADGAGLFKPGKNPRENYKFLVFLCAVIRAVDLHQDLLRISVASAGNDHRLGGNEAPPAIISMFLGDEITNLLNSFTTDQNPDKAKRLELETGVKTLPHLRTDGSDRNRTSPFAFTGNKFEFRMVGSSQSIADCNTVLNTIVADSLSYFADILENGGDIKSGVKEIVKETVEKHGRIIFNGNGYTEEWPKEAHRRGLLNLKTTADCVPLLCSEENIAFFEKYGIYSREELVARTEILLDNYCKVVNIEAVTMISMANRYIYGGVIGYINKLKGCANLLPSCEKTIKILAVSLEKMVTATDELSELLARTEKLPTEKEMAESYRDEIIPKMAEVRAAADMLDRYTEKEFWPFPTYGDLLLRI